MARRSITITLNAGDRDDGKVYTITEMPATKAEKWARRALLALVKGTGGEIPDDIAKMGFAGFAYVGVQALAGLNDDALEPLLDEMMTCVTYHPNPANMAIVRPYKPGVDECDIEEITTLLRLRREILELHVGFSLGSVLSRFRTMTAATTTDADTPSMSMSPSL